MDKTTAGGLGAGWGLVALAIILGGVGIWTLYRYSICCYCFWRLLLLLLGSLKLLI